MEKPRDYLKIGNKVFVKVDPAHPQAAAENLARALGIELKPPSEPAANTRDDEPR